MFCAIFMLGSHPQGCDPYFPNGKCRHFFMFSPFLIFLMKTLSLSGAVKHCMIKLGPLGPKYQVVLLTGLPGSGKSTITRMFAKTLDLDPIGLSLFRASVITGDDFVHQTGLLNKHGLPLWDVKVFELESNIWSTPVLIDCTAANLNSLILGLVLRFGSQNIHVMELDTPLATLKHVYNTRGETDLRGLKVKNYFTLMSKLSLNQISELKKEFSSELAHFTSIWNISHSKVRVNRKLPNGLLHDLDSSANTDGYCSPYSVVDALFSRTQNSDSPSLND